MNSWFRCARTHLVALLILVGALPDLPAQPPTSLTDDDDNDTTLIYSFPMLRMRKEAFVDLGSQGIRTTLTMHNIGDGDLIVHSFEWYRPGEYSIASQEILPLILPPGGQKAVEILYTGTKPIDSLPYNSLAVISNSRPIMDVAVVLDVSRSMVQNSAECHGNWLTKLEIAKARTKQFIDSALLYIPELGVQDNLTFATYSEYITRHFPLTEINETVRNKVKTIIDTINVISTTWTGRSLSLLIQNSHWNPDRRHVLIMITDGQTHREDQFGFPPSSVTAEAKTAGVSIYAVSITPRDSAITQYLDSITIPTGGITTVADNCTGLGRALSILSVASHSNTIDWEPFPEGQTLSTPVIKEYTAPSVAFTGITPNPARDQIEMTVRTNGKSEAKILFYNVQGEQVGAPITEGISGTEEHTLIVDVRAFPAGVYVAVLKTADGAQASMRFTLIK